MHVGDVTVINVFVMCLTDITAQFTYLGQVVSLDFGSL